MTPGWFTVLVALVALERVVELVVATRHLAWATARGGVESGRRHYPWMVLLHTGLLAGCLVEAWVAHRGPHPVLGGVMAGVVVLTQLLRWWCIRTLGPQWNTRIVIVPGLAPVTSGPYRFLPHPNYLAVAVEGLALPLAGSAWVTAIIFTVLNAWLMTIRIPAEEKALRTLVASGSTSGDSTGGESRG